MHLIPMLNHLPKHLNIDNILYSSPDFPSGKDINRPKQPPIQEAPIGQKRYRYTVLPELFAKIRFNFGFCPLSASGLTIKKSAYSADFKGCLRLEMSGQANDRPELLRTFRYFLTCGGTLRGMGGCLKRAILFGG